MTKQWSEISPALENLDAEGAPLSEADEGVSFSEPECCICMVNYMPESFVIQLKCHPGHVFHLDCFSKFIEGVSEDIG
jgi:hypothetical protein